jgi:predicted TIM-barrel fold metal-dependent hydrolase
MYDGPIVDAHHHFWDFGLGRHPWLMSGEAGDEIAPLRRDFLPDDYARMAAGCGIVGSVHVEGNWDPADPMGETEWLDGLERPAGIAARYVAYAPLLEPRAAGILERHAAHERVAGIREILSWHPDPAKRRLPDNDRLTSPVWRQNLGFLSRYGFSFDLLVSPWQLDDVRRLAETFPDISFILNHCGSPMDRDAGGMRRWRAGLASAAKAGNVSIKISDPVAYDPHWSFDSLADVMLTAIDLFGPARSMFASDYPVAGLHIGFAEWIDVFRRVAARFSAAEQRAIFHDNAAALYRMADHPPQP